MSGIALLDVLVLPIALGLLGFIEPCSIGSSVIFIKHVQGKQAAAKLANVAIFTISRALFIGLLGAAALSVGTAFLGFQRIAWMVLGSFYIGVGVLYLSGRASLLKVPFGLTRHHGLRGSLGLGLLFGLNVPACAAPLVFALLASAAARGATGATLAAGFLSLALFGLALSFPLVAAVLFAPARRALDRLADVSDRLPLWMGALLVVLGLWSIGFALFSRIHA